MNRLILIASSLAVAVAVTSCGVFSTSGTTKQPSTMTITSPTHSKISSDALAGEWTVYTVGGHKVTGETRPYLNFSMEDHRLYGSNGCNVINGDFELDGNSGLKITNLISTMMACADAPYERAINLALEAAQNFSITRRDHEYYLDLTDSRGNNLMTLRKHNMDFLNGTWEVSDINGQAVDNPDMKLVIDIQEQKLHGNSGCNIVNGSLLIDPDKSNSIQFQNLATTRMACPEATMRQETALLVALESVEFAKKGRTNTVVMLDKNDTPLLTLTKVNVDLP